MPVKSGTISSTSPVDIIVPPKNRKIVITAIRLNNNVSSDVVLTLQQVSPDGSLTKQVDKIPVKAGEEFGMTLDSGVYDLGRGFKLQAFVDANQVDYFIKYHFE